MLGVKAGFDKLGVKAGFDMLGVKAGFDMGVIPDTLDIRALFTLDMGVIPETLGGAIRPGFLLRRLPFMMGPCLAD